jgi:hypothetical protein
MPPLAYLLTFSTYGTHLPGSEKGWIDRGRNAYASPISEANPIRKAYWQAHLNECPWRLDADARRITLRAITSVCQHRGWIAYTVHIRTTHIHAVVAGETAPERMLSDFKAYATRALRENVSQPQRRRYWAHHGSTRYLWNTVSLKAAIEYVLNGQGERLECYLEEAI